MLILKTEIKNRDENGSFFGKSSKEMYFWGESDEEIAQKAKELVLESLREKRKKGERK